MNKTELATAANDNLCVGNDEAFSIQAALKE